MRLIKITNPNQRDIDIAEELGKKSFSEEEYLSIKYCITNNEYEVYFIYLDGNIFGGYIITKIYDNIVYLFFITIQETLRDLGIGTEALNSLNDIYKDKIIYVDIEMVDINKEEVERKKRKLFYLNNGYKITGWFLSYYNEYYEILINKEPIDINKFKALMNSINTDKKDFNMEFFNIIPNKN